MIKKSYRILVFLLSMGAFVLTACGGDVVETAENDLDNQQEEVVNAEPEQEEEPEENALPDPPTDGLVENLSPPSGAATQFITDFSISIVDFNEILSGGPPKDGIPAVDEPQFASIAEADEWLDDSEPVVSITHNGETRAYPIQILMWHEIVNDTLGGEPVTVTFCPLCNTAIVFSGNLDNVELDFGTTGRLRFSNLIMYDRPTETWWQQATGQAIVGKLTGKQLTFLPAAMISWEQFKESFPDSVVLSRETGFIRRYGANPYTGYDDVRTSPFLYLGPDTPGQLPAMARVLTVEISDQAVAYPYEVMQEVGVVNDSVGGQDVVIFWQPGVASALDTSSIAAGTDVGAVAAFSRIVDGETLTFTFVDGKIIDKQTQSVWNVLGEAVSGELVGSVLEQVVSINHFWFSWAAFRPETTVYSAD